MLYYFAKYLSKLGLRINFRKIYFNYHAEVPKDKAIIFAANHPTAFLDPVLLGTCLSRPTHFIVRGDIFKGKLILAILNGLKMLPIFRFRDGYSNLKNNQATMDTVYKKLAEKACVLVLAEGETKHEKRLRPIQKGTARMAFGAMEAYGQEDILIIPVGVNYTDAHQFRSFIIGEIGKPIALKDYMSVYEENPRKAINQVTKQLEKDMRGLVTHIEKEEDDYWIDRILAIKRNDFKYPLFPIRSADPSLWQGEYTAVEKMNHFSESDKAKYHDQVKAYDQQLNQLKVRDLGVARRQSFSLLNTLLLILGFVPFLIGLVFNFLPIYLAEKTAATKVKKVEFHASVRYGVLLFGYPVYWLIFFIVSLIIGDIRGIAFVFIMPFIGYFALVYSEVFEKWNAARKFKALSKAAQADLIKARGEVTDFG